MDFASLKQMLREISSPQTGRSSKWPQANIADEVEETLNSKLTQADGRT